MQKWISVDKPNFYLVFHWDIPATIIVLVYFANKPYVYFEFR